VKLPSSSLVKVPRVMAMIVLLAGVSQDRPCDGSRQEPASRPRPPRRGAAGPQGRTGETGEFAAQRPRGGRRAGRGNSSGGPVGRGRRGIQRLVRHARGGLAQTGAKEIMARRQRLHPGHDGGKPASGTRGNRPPCLSGRESQRPPEPPVVMGSAGRRRWARMIMNLASRLIRAVGAPRIEPWGWSGHQNRTPQ